MAFLYVLALSAQSNETEPVQILQSESGLVVDWQIDSFAEEDVNSIESLVAGGWRDELSYELPLPTYHLVVTELEGSDLSDSSEIVESVTIIQQHSWPHSLERREMPVMTGPDGEELPLISPLTRPEIALPMQPVFVHREGVQRGKKMYVIAISPIFADGTTTVLATRGTATLLGVESAEISMVSLADRLDTAGNDASSALNIGRESPLPTPVAPLPTVTSRPPQTSPLAQPRETPVNAANTATPAQATAAGTGGAFSGDQGGQEQPETADALVAGTPSEASTPGEAENGDDSEVFSKASGPLVKLPWTGILLFSFLSLATVFVLFRGIS